MRDKPGPSKRFCDKKTLRSQPKKLRTISEADSLEGGEYSSEETVQCTEEEEGSDSSRDSDCSNFDICARNRKLSTNLLPPSCHQQVLTSTPFSDKNILPQTLEISVSPSIIQDYGENLPDIPVNISDDSAKPPVSLLRSTALTPDFPKDYDSITTSGTAILPSQDIAESTSYTPSLPQNYLTSDNKYHQNIKIPSQQGSRSYWSTNRSLKTIIFTKNQELLVPAPSDPFEAFRLLLDDDILDLIVRETNLNAARILQAPDVRSKSRIISWKNLTRQELLTFLGLLLHTGTIRLNRLTDYWKKHWLFNIPSFSQYMSRNRFMLILRCLHFSSEHSSKDKLVKIRPIIDNFNNTMSRIYYPGKQLSLDESMVLWRGCLLFRQYIKNKRHKYGIKLYVLGEPEGLVLRFQIYAGADDETAGKGHTQKIVLKLLEENLDSGHSVYMDNYFNSYDLAVKLLDRQTYCTGTLNKNRKGNPVDLETVTLNKGENKSLFLNDVHIGKWKDKRYVMYISTEHDDEMLKVTNKRGQVLVKPSAIVNYNSFMSGMDLQDQMLSYYPCEGKTMRWYKKMFIHTLQMSLSNAFYLYNKYCVASKMNLYDFRLAILEKLLPKPNELVPKRNVVNNHKLTKIETVKVRKKKEGNSTRIIKEVVRKECKGCRENKKRVATLYECKVCDGWPGFCVECFFVFH